MSYSNLPASLQLNRQLQNHAFESWKIGSNFVAQRHECVLPEPVYQGAGEAVDFVHTRASLLCNHLFSSQGRLFVVISKTSTSVCVCEVDCASLGQHAAPVISEVADIPVAAAAAADPAVAPTDAALHASLAAIATPLGATHVQNTDGLPSATAAGVSAGYQALVSTGKGDLVLVTHTPGQPAGVSAPVHPLRHPAPELGCKPFSISAVWVNPAGLIRTVLSCLTDTSANTNSSSSSSSAAAGQHQQRHPGQSAWVCETWLVTLSAQHQQQQQQQQQLQVLDCQLLLVSQAPPAAAVGCAAADKLLLVSEPCLEESQLSPGYRHLLAAAMGWSQQQSNTPMDTDTPAAAAAAGAAAAAAGGAGIPAGGSAGGMIIDDDDDDDVDPRTLAAAAARLAKYTSEAEVGDLGPQQWSDVFKETGPGELGAGGSEPAADILLFCPADAPTSSSTSSSPPAAATATAAAAAAATAGVTDVAGRFKLQSIVSCGPHRLLTAENLTVALSNGSVQDAGVLLGVTDDVDCAVVTAAFSNAAAAAAAASPPAAAAGTASSSGSSGVLTLTHEAFLPALAYVAAGKTQKRHLLLGQGGSSPVCCALVEGFKYTYLYGQVTQGATHGQQQIVDMELPHGKSILGARLFVLNNSSAGNPAAGAALLLLTQSHLLCYLLKGLA